MSDWKPVATSLLGTWPNQVRTWGKEGIAAYCSELEARGVTPDVALVGIRTFDPDADFPPSVAKLAAQVRRDPSEPSSAEVAQLLWSSGGAMYARAEYPAGGWGGLDRAAVADERAIEAKAAELHPMLGRFVSTVGVGRLKHLNVRDPEWGEANRKRLYEEWDRFVDRVRERGVAELVAKSGRGELGRVDPLALLPGREQTGDAA